VALLLLALIVLLLVFESLRGRETATDAGHPAVDVAPVPPPPVPEAPSVAPTTPRPQVRSLRPGIDLAPPRQRRSNIPDLRMPSRPIAVPRPDPAPEGAVPAPPAGELP
jgi:hypothetical protein